MELIIISINWTSPSSGQLLNIYDHIEGLLKCLAGNISTFFYVMGQQINSKLIRMTII